METSKEPPSITPSENEQYHAKPTRIYLWLLNPMIWFGFIFTLLLIAFIVFPQAKIFSDSLFVSEKIAFDTAYGIAYSENEEDLYWEIEYEAHSHEIFSGLIRKVLPIRERIFPVLTHDILVTNADFADPTKVAVSVFNHHFTWRSNSKNAPEGTINLLHTIPANNAILDQLSQLRTGDLVSIEGYEILSVKYWKGTSHIATWQDTGCNTILVTAVKIINTSSD